MYDTIEEFLIHCVNLEAYDAYKYCAVFATGCYEIEGCKEEWTIDDIAEEAKKLGYGVHFTECSWNGPKDYLIVSPVVSIEDAIVSQYWTREDMFPKDLRSLINWRQVEYIENVLMGEDELSDIEDDYDAMQYELDMMYYEDYEEDLGEDTEC